MGGNLTVRLIFTTIVTIITHGILSVELHRAMREKHPLLVVAVSLSLAVGIALVTWQILS